MFKIVALLALVAVATAAPGLVAGVLPASTGPLTYAVAAPVAVAHAPVALAAPATIAVAHSAPVAIPAPVAYSTGVKVVHTYEPVEQHGYKIAY
ncbi:unnamed protein product [Allacma fusca]|uniref:Uncharacterized protein n=1 Tax=Allacma fusca TaxID=39272 RepID=A0A8J2M562_9HEXA|nr:unnamed protein product [Allacma fusca]